MKPIPRLFKRDGDGGDFIDEPAHPGLANVLKGSAVPTTQLDGVAVYCDGFARLFREYVWRPGLGVGWPEGFQPSIEVKEGDEWPAKVPGWLPVDLDMRPEGVESTHAWLHSHAGEEYVDIMPTVLDAYWNAGAAEIAPGKGTYEIVGPGINGNPHDLKRPTMTPHGGGMLGWQFGAGHAFGLEELRRYMADPKLLIGKGVVWWSKDRRNARPIAMMTRADLGIPWPMSAEMPAAEAPEPAPTEGVES